ncbi:MAG: sigma-70 family RNA polymerase sigma factor [Ferruginibacter sp.]
MPIGGPYTIFDLFRRIAEGDQQAFKEVFDACWPQVYGTTLRLIKSPEQAKDLAQDIFMRLWENREKLKTVQNPQSYIYILSRNLVMDHLRKKVFNPSNIDFLVRYFQGDVASPQDKIELQELEVVIRNAVEALPGRVKVVYQLSRYEGLTHEQIAKRLNISIVSSKTYIVRALQHIREYIASHSDERMLIVVFPLFFR